MSKTFNDIEIIFESIKNIVRDADSISYADRRVVAGHLANVMDILEVPVVDRVFAASSGLRMIGFDYVPTGQRVTFFANEPTTQLIMKKLTGIDLAAMMRNASPFPPDWEDVSEEE